MKICPVCTKENRDDAVNCKNQECRYSFKSKDTIQETDIKLMFETGDVIDGRFIIEKKLGQGGMGSVYLVRHNQLDRQYALKILHPFLAKQQTLVQRFKEEVLIGQDLLHKNIVPIYEYHDWNDYHFFTMKYLDGKSLDQLMAQRGGKKPPFSVKEAVLILDQILSALHHAHKRTIHRDIKPANIMISGRFPDIEIQVLDFGIAKALSPSRFRESAQAEGAFFYIAPEQSEGIVDIRSDLYSSGVIFYQLLTGEIPAGRFPLPGELIENIPDSLDKFIDKALFYRAEGRFENALIMRNELKKILLSSDKRLEVRQEQEEKFEAVNTQESDQDNWTDPVTDMEFVWVPEGCFQMGSNSSDAFTNEQPVHEVCLEGFWMAKYVVTQKQWKQIKGDNPSHFRGDNRPVERVSWKDAKDFINKLNQKSDVTFALPTEAQWEYAARSGGKDEKYAGGLDPDRVAWYNENSGGETHSVGTKDPNGLGIYDMSGNVWEWCEDFYATSAYSKHSRNNPVVLSGVSFRVYRGGSWNNRSRFVRCAYRDRFRPSYTYYNLGFRLIRKN